LLFHSPFWYFIKTFVHDFSPVEGTGENPRRTFLEEAFAAAFAREAVLHAKRGKLGTDV
jgi:hypothetical protein